MPGPGFETFSSTLSIAVDGERLLLDLDGLGTGFLELDSGRREGSPPYVGELGNYGIDCLFLNDPDNYPILTCKFWTADREGGEGLVTFWPDP